MIFSTLAERAGVAEAVENKRALPDLTDDQNQYLSAIYDVISEIEEFDYDVDNIPSAILRSAVKEISSDVIEDILLSLEVHCLELVAGFRDSNCYEEEDPSNIKIVE